MLPRTIQNRGMNNNLFCRKNINLLKELTISNFKLRNEGSILGILWYLINPLLMLTVLYVVFSKSVGSSIEHYAFYVLIGVIQWNFFSASTTDAMYSIESYSIMIRKVPFRKELLILGVVTNIFLSHLIEWVLMLTLIIIILGISNAFILLPIIILMQLMLSITISLTLGIIITYYRDIKNIWRNIIFIAWFLTPIFYLKSAIPKSFSFINSINPMTWIISFTRTILIDKAFPTLSETIIIFVSLAILLIICLIIFRKFSINMAERI